MRLGRKSRPPIEKICSCGCGQPIQLTAEERHILKVAAGRSAWRYRAIYVKVGAVWVIHHIMSTRHFQPRHRRAPLAWMPEEVSLPTRRPRRALDFCPKPAGAERADVRSV